MKKRIFALFLLLALLGNMIFVVHAEAEQRTLTENVETLSIDTSCVLDLDGYSVASLQVAKGAKVTLKDSQTDDFDAENGRGYGRIGTVSGTVKAGSGYVLITEADGLSAHRLQLWISEVTLSLGNLQEDGAALSYKATFGGDQVIARNVEGFGVAMGSMGKEPTFNEGTYVQVDGSHWLTGTTFTRNSAKVYGILKASNTDTVNLGNAEVPVTCRPFVQLNGAENRIQGPMASYNLRQILEGDGVTTLGVNGNWDSFT